MKKYTLQSDDFISAATGVHVSYHVISWDELEHSVSLGTDGGNIIHHTLISATKPHTHQFLEICLVINGNINHFVNGSVQSLSQGNIVFIRPSDQHYFSRLKNRNCELINFAVRLDSLLELSHYLGNDVFMQKFTATVLPFVFRMTLSQMDEFSNELLSINTLQITNPVSAKIKAKSLLLNFFTKYFLSEEFSVFQEDGKPEWLEQFCKKIKQPEILRSGIEAAAKLAPCTHEHLCKVCRKYLNKTPTELLNEFRMQEAARRLAKEKEKIYSITVDMGFKSPSYFYSLFRETYGVSPAVYRKQARNCNLVPI